MMKNPGFNKNRLTLKLLILVLLILFGFSNTLMVNAFLPSSQTSFFKNDVIEVNVGVNGRAVSDYIEVSKSNPVEVTISATLSEDIYVKSFEGELKAKGWRGRLFLAALRLAKIRVYVPILNQKVLVENPKRMELERDFKRLSVSKSVNFHPKEGYVEFFGMKMKLPSAVPSGEYYITGKAVYVLDGGTKFASKTFTLKLK